MDKRAIRVNVEVVYDDGTFEEAAIDRPEVWRGALPNMVGKPRPWPVDDIQVAFEMMREVVGAVKGLL